MDLNSKIYIAGHTGLVGSALLRKIREKGYNNLLLIPIEELDLTSQSAVDNLFKTEKPGYIFLAAAKVGGIIANNTYRAEFIYQNLQIQNNIIHQAYRYGVKKLLFLGSSCIYPKNAPQPLKEDYLLTSELEYTNEPYSVAKIAGMKMCEAYNIQYGTNFISVMPTNLYGPGDNYNLETSHVLPALVRKFHLARCLEQGDTEGIRKDFNKRPIEGVDGNAREEDIGKVLAKYGIRKTGNKAEITLWGTGKPRREFLYVDELAAACVFLMENIDFKDLVNKSKNIGTDEIRNTHINIGTGEDLTIRELSELIKDITGFTGTITWDSSKPDGTPQKLLDVSKLNRLGWKSRITLEDGLRKVYKHYVEEY